MQKVLSFSEFPPMLLYNSDYQHIPIIPNPPSSAPLGKVAEGSEHTRNTARRQRKIPLNHVKTQIGHETVKCHFLSSYSMLPDSFCPLAGSLPVIGQYRFGLS